MTGDATRDQLAAVLCAKEGATVDDLTPESRTALFADLDALLPVVRKIAAAELRAAAGELDAKSAETWKAYKTASPDDPRRANPYYDGAADAYETAATLVLRRADALDPS